MLKHTILFLLLSLSSLGSSAKENPLWLKCDLTDIERPWSLEHYGTLAIYARDINRPFDIKWSVPKLNLETDSEGSMIPGLEENLRFSITLNQSSFPDLEVAPQHRLIFQMVRPEYKNPRFAAGEGFVYNGDLNVFDESGEKVKYFSSLCTKEIDLRIDTK